MKLLFSFLFLVIALTQLPVDAKTKKSHSKKQKYTKGIIKITDYPKGKIVKFLKYKQFQRLEYWNRVRYIEEVRQAILDVDAIQKKFGVRHASLIQFKENKMYASLFENMAFAQAEQARGENITDGCIASGDMSVYKKRGQYNPFGCKPIACKRADQATGRPQLRCGFVLTGLSGDNGCVPKYNESKEGIRRHSPTEDCWEKSSQLYASNKNANTPRIQSILAKAREMKDKPEAEVKAWLKSDQAKSDVAWLKENSYDPRALAHLVGFAQTYAAAGLQDLVPELHQEWDALVTGIDNILLSFKEHCDTPLSKSTVDKIASGESSRSAPAGWTRQKEQDRYKRAQELMVKQGKSTATVREVLQVPECRIVDERIAQINENISIINSTYPIVGQAVPIAPKRPPEPPKPAHEVEHLGCTDVLRKEHHLPQSGMRCVACAAERAMIEKEGDPSYYVSRKWLSLLSTMALVCGDGCMAGKDVRITPEMAQEYIQSFGHCDDSQYSWNDTSLSETDEGLVTSWGQDGKFVEYLDRNKNNTKKINNDFHRIYGAQLDDLIPYFCNSSNHKTWSKARNRKCNNIEQESIEERYKRRKKGLEKLTKNGGLAGSIRRLVGLDKEKSKSLKKCFESSLENVNVLYTGSKAKCMAFVDSTGQNEKLFAEQSANGNGNFASMQGQCSTAKQIEYSRTGSGETTRIVWQLPNMLSPNNPNSIFGSEYSSSITYYEKNQESPQLQNRFLAYERFGEDIQNQQSSINSFEEERFNRKLAILDSNSCPGGGGSSPGSRGSTKGTR